MKKKLLKLKVITGLCLAWVIISSSLLKAQAPVTMTFTHTGAQQTFTVPSCVGSMTITAWGAVGATGGGSGSAGANGGAVRGVITATPGQVMYFNVGGQGSVTAGGFNGGGAGGVSSSNSGGGGGGASDVRVVGNALSNRIIVAAGGGGGGGSTTFLPTGGSGGGGSAFTSATGFGGAGAGGCAIGTNGAESGGTATSYGSGGGGAGFSSGGAGGGQPSSTTGGYGCTGALGAGGAGGGTSFICGGATGGINGGGGGGGGYYGGGGGMTGTGGCNGGGGGGSSYISPLFSSPGFTAGTSAGHGTIIITYAFNGPGVTVSGYPAVCSGSSTALTAGSVSSYTWLPVGSFAGSNSAGITVSPTSNTTYTVNGTNSIGCLSSTVITVTVNTGGAPVLSVSNPSNNLCLGRTATLTASGALTYTWTGGVTNGVPFAPSVTSSYTVAGQNGCGTTTAVTTITIAPLPVSSLATPTVVCGGSTTTLVAVSSVGGYTWQPLGIPGQSVVVSPTATTVYTVTASDGTCSGVSNVTVVALPVPTIGAVTSSSIVCENSTITLSASGGISYTWTPGGIGGTITANPNAPTLYQVVGSNSLGCTSAANVIVLTNPSPTIIAATANPLICMGGSAVLTSNGALTYTWVNGPANSNYIVSPQTTSSYTVTGVNSGGCSDTKVITVSVFSPSVNVTSVGSSICPGGTATLIASGANSYTWSNSLGNNPSVLVTPLVNTTYTVSAKTTSNTVSCLSSNTVLISLFNTPTITIVATKTVMCRKDANAILTAQGGTAYVWNNAATTTTINASSASAINTTYSVTGTDNNGCVNTGTILIKVLTCTGIAELNGSQNTINVYPNPSNGEFTISSENTISVKLINQIGQEIRVINLSSQNDHKVSVSDLPSGVYFIVGQNQTEKLNQKIVITR
jgi:hypothetical protein